MFEPMKKIQGNVLAIKITGEITEKEHVKLDRLILESIAVCGGLIRGGLMMHEMWRSPWSQKTPICVSLWTWMRFLLTAGGTI